MLADLTSENNLLGIAAGAIVLSGFIADRIRKAIEHRKAVKVKKEAEDLAAKIKRESDEKALKAALEFLDMKPTIQNLVATVTDIKTTLTMKNGGSSMKDQVDRIEACQTEQTKSIGKLFDLSEGTQNEVATIKSYLVGADGIDPSTFSTSSH